MICYIYCLYHWDIKYIGRTVRNPEKRFKCHLNESKLKPNVLKNKWIQECLMNDIDINIFVLEETTNEMGEEREQWWIDECLRIGKNLVNSGKACGGVFKHSEQTREKISKSVKQHIKDNPEHREKISNRMLGNTIAKGKRTEEANKKTLERKIRQGKQKNNKSGYKGVLFFRGKWVAKIKVNKKSFYLGSFNNVIEAAKAYNAAAIKYFGENAYLNPIDEKSSE